MGVVPCVAYKTYTVVTLVDISGFENLKKRLLLKKLNFSDFCFFLSVTIVFAYVSFQLGPRQSLL